MNKLARCVVLVQHRIGASPYPFLKARAFSMDASMAAFAKLERKLAQAKAADDSQTDSGDRGQRQVANEEATSGQRQVANEEARSGAAAAAATGQEAAANAQAAATAQETPRVIPEKPEQPDPSMCCGSTCANCVWTDYFDALQIWEDYQAKQKELESKP